MRVHILSRGLFWSAIFPFLWRVENFPFAIISRTVKRVIVNRTVNYSAAKSFTVVLNAESTDDKSTNSPRSMERGKIRESQFRSRVKFPCNQVFWFGVRIVVKLALKILGNGGKKRKGDQRLLQKLSTYHFKGKRKI